MSEEEQEPIIRIPNAPGNLNIGDYVFACKWSDADPGDPWAVGHVSQLSDSAEDYGYVVLGDCPMPYRHFWKAVKITPEQGARIIEAYHRLGPLPTDYKAIADVWKGVF